MADGQGRERIAILGGGLGSLTTAFELTATPELRERYDVTIYQMGWRLGGKCATGRGPCGRIEEHGIHGFLGSYYNALPMMARLYEALDRPEGHKLRTFADAFRQEDFVLMWEVEGGRWTKWPMTMPPNDLDPAKPKDVDEVAGNIRDMGRFVHAMFEQMKDHLEAEHHGLLGRLIDVGYHLFEWFERNVLGADDERTLEHVEAVAQRLEAMAPELVHGNAALRQSFILLDYMVSLIRAAVTFDVANKGFDALDDMNFDEMLRQAKARPITITSPVALNTTNLSYQYPNGDTSLPPDMAAGAYLHWTLRSFAYLGSFAWLFEVGTGETIIQPLHECLSARGVKFEFFHKVEALRLSEDRSRIAAVEMAVQATPKGEYDPFIEVADLKCWPAHPIYERLEEGDALRRGEELEPGMDGERGYDLESWWTAWKPVGSRTIRDGEDYDRVILGISIGALPHIAGELLEASEAWRAMCEHVTTVPTQAMQIWLDKPREELGWTTPIPKDRRPDGGYGSDNTPIGATFANPQSGSADFSHLIDHEAWPADATPRAVWYLCGPMDDYDEVPPFSDHDYPKRMKDRVRWQSVQYLQASFGALLPDAVVAVQRPPGDAMGLDFGLLTCPADPEAVGISRFRQQFTRPNIDPTERYVTSPAGSTKYRIKAGETGFDNLVITGDWIYTGLNVGSVEGTVMGGRAAANAISGLPRLEDIPGYLLGAGKPG